MSQIQNGSAPITTTANAFFPCNPERQALFSVAPDVPILHALEAASCFLSEIEKVIFEQEFAPTGCRLIVEASVALIDSAVQALMEAGKARPCDEPEL
jgi:hypothetical protein